MGILKAISDAIYREYDRRIKRASLVTEYGAHHHDDHGAHAGDAHAEETHAEEAHTLEQSVAEELVADEEEAEIVNVPRGTPVVISEHAPAESAAADATPGAPGDPQETTEAT
jgi:hypothetical protein